MNRPWQYVVRWLSFQPASRNPFREIARVPEKPNWWARVRLQARTGDVPYQLITSRIELLAWRLFLGFLALGGAGYAVYDVARQDWRAAIGGALIGIVGHLLFRSVGTREWAWLGADYLLIPTRGNSKIRFSTLRAVGTSNYDAPPGRAITIVYAQRGFGSGLLPWVRGSQEEATVGLLDPESFVSDLRARIEDRYGADRWEQLQVAARG